MVELFKTRITAVWILLVGATAVSWEMGHGLLFQDARSAAIAIIAVALIKVRFVMLEFMELRDAPPAARWITEAWIVGIGALLIAMYLGAVRLPV